MFAAQTREQGASVRKLSGGGFDRPGGTPQSPGDLLPQGADESSGDSAIPFGAAPEPGPEPGPGPGPEPGLGAGPEPEPEPEPPKKSQEELLMERMLAAPAADASDGQSGHRMSGDEIAESELSEEIAESISDGEIFQPRLHASCTAIIDMVWCPGGQDYSEDNDFEASGSTSNGGFGFAAGDSEDEDYGEF